VLDSLVIDHFLSAIEIVNIIKTLTFMIFYFEMIDANSSIKDLQIGCAKPQSNNVAIEVIKKTTFICRFHNMDNITKS